MTNGKRTSKHNAVTHGILADILLVGDHLGESKETYRRLLSALQKSMRPTDNFGELQIEKLAFLYIRLARVYKADWRLAPKLFEKLEESIDAEHPFVTRVLGDFCEVMGQRKDPTPELLVRYENNIERQISRTIDQFERWRTMRPNDSQRPAELGEQIESQEGKDALAENTIPSPATEGEPPNASRTAARGVAMGEEESASADLERLCQGISPSVGACTYPATVRCTSCKKWFCDAHAEDGQWHSCMLSDQ